ncbi:class I SAM-dependent methyltransferase [Nocardioides sp. zg-536]|uniref:Class I SAM-dependent methyltransferase n=1 Tax=Nocardioides faecalis TaxID=2803858 RepID=A0A938Y9N0_9ACTN|nr:class I SAM-dependent methyltransferase [Nocardioides faecalis]MBM9459799.1 class I SAM-dependent methyltransferase [Nocardioides faecalis]MBS4753423.1 class I SAM-dependent methyltransferase [Nocardioides faecalis]QVI58308.1 class I SAM-dependent methyltransferase [Nocardioides faecalis]
MPELPPTRWALEGARTSGYGTRFAELIERGEDVDGEARLADAMVPRGARILDAGSGMGRVGAYLLARGHRVLAAEPDPVLVAQSRRTYPDLRVVPAEILALDAATLRAAGGPDELDLVVCVGNVLPFVAEGTEADVLRRLGELLAPGGRILVGFHLTGGPASARSYSPAEFLADVAAAGLLVQHRFGGYDLRPVDDQYAVWVLARA